MASVCNCCPTVNPKTNRKARQNATARTGCTALLLALFGLAQAQDDGRRFKLTPLDEMTPAQRVVADNIRSGPRAAVAGSAANASTTTLGSPFNVWLRSPELADQLQKLGAQIRFKSSLSPRLNEFAILITARHWTSQYEWFAHHRLALQAGLSPQVADAVAQGRRPDTLQPDEEAVYEFTRELHTQQRVADATYQRALAQFGEQGVVDLIAVTGYYVLVSMTLNVDRTPVPGGNPVLLPPLAQPLPLR